MKSNTTSDLLEQLLERLRQSEKTDEGLEIEYKAARESIPQSLWETVSAFANTEGGWILLGITKEGKVQGVSNPSKMMEDFFNSLSNTLKINHCVCEGGDVYEERIGDKEIIIVRVPEMNRKQKPIFINNNPYTGTYVRRHSGDYRCKKDEVIRMIRESSDNSVDSEVIPDFGLDDIDQGSLVNYRQRFQTIHPADERINYDNKKFLKSINGYRYDRESQKEGLTVAGLLLLGTDEAIREWRSYHLIDYRLVNNENDSSTRWDDRITWEGNLLKAFDTIYPRLTKDLTVAFRLRGPVRSNESPVHTVLREALVNLLVHTDYTEPKVISIQRTPSSFIFRNPGSSRIPIDDLLNDARSDPRNPELVRMFRLIGLAEQAGSGIPNILRAWHDLDLAVPAIDNDTERYEFTLHLRQSHLFSTEDRRWLRSLGSAWNELEQLALVQARHYKYIDNATLRKLSGKHGADVSRVLVSLRSRGFLEKIGVGQNTKYQLGPLAVEILQPSTSKRKPSPQESIPEDIWSKLLEIGSIARGQSSIDRATLEDIIVRLCSFIPLSLRDLGILLNRKPGYLQRTIVPNLHTSGRLGFLFPDQPNSRYQRYISSNINTTPKISSPSVVDEKNTNKAMQQSTLDLDLI